MFSCLITEMKGRRSSMRRSLEEECTVFPWTKSPSGLLGRKTGFLTGFCKGKVVNTRENHTRTVGIAGSIRGSGVTHLAISLANYGASGRLEKCAYIEADGHGELSHWRKPGELGFFEEKRVHYYPDVKKEDIPIILNRDYEKVIFDFGEKYLSFREEILRCDQKIFLLNLNVWQKFAAGRLLMELKEQDWDSITPLFASSFASETVKSQIEREYQIKVLKLSGLEDAFRVHSQSFSLMNRLLGESIPTKRKFSLNLTKRKM